MANEGIQLEVYSRSDPNQLIGRLRARREPQALREIGSIGGGTFLVSTSDRQVKKNPNLLKSRNIIKYKVNGVVFTAAIMGEKEVVTIAEGEYAGEYYQWAAVGLKFWLDDAEVRPWKGLKKTSKDTRSFSFASEEGSWYNASEWINPINSGHKVRSKAWANGPDKWPDGANQAPWVWGTANSNRSAAVGDNYFRLKLNSAGGSYVLYVAADDNYSVYLDGEEIATTDYDVGFWQEAKKIEFDLAFGIHFIGIRVTNLRGAAGLAAALFKIKDAVLPSAVGTPTIPIGTTPTITLNGHGLESGEKVYLTTTGALPTGLSVDKNYYVTTVTANTFKLANTPAGPSINTSGSQSGVHTLWRAEVPEQERLVTFAGMSVTALTTAYNAADNIVDTRWNTYNSLPAGNVNGNNTEKKQYSAKRKAYAAWQKAVQDRNLIGTQRSAAVAAASADITWKVLPYPAEAPGWTPGEIMTTLLSEAAARGVVMASLLTPSFTPTHDSYGNAWGAPLEWTFSIGESLLSVANKLEELACDIWIDPETYELHMVGERGVDRSTYKYDVDGISVIETPVIFQSGKNLRRAAIKSRGKIKNSLSVRTNIGWLPAPETDTASIAEYGVIEGTLDTGASATVSKQLASRIFKQRAVEEEGASYDVWIDPNDPKAKIPGVDFEEGDWVRAPDELGILVRRRVMSISLAEGPSAQPVYTLEFDTIFQTNERRLNKVIEKMGGGGVGSGYSNASGTKASSPSKPAQLPKPIYVPTATLPEAPTDLEVFSIGGWTTDGVTPYAEFNIQWEPVTQNTDGTETVPSYYEVWGYENELVDGVEIVSNANTAVVLSSATEPKATIYPFVPGTTWTFWVIAYNAPDRASAPSDEVSHVMVGPVEPMPAPDAPTMTSDKGNLVVTWNGQLGGDAPPPQFRYVYAQLSVDGVSGWVRKGPTLQRDGRQILIPGEAIGETRYARLIAVDGMGIASSPSAIASTEVTGIDLGDLDESIGEAIEAAQEASLAAREQMNMLSDASFELNTQEFWDWWEGRVTNVDTDPRAGLRSLRITGNASAYEAVAYTRALSCEPGDVFYFRIYVKPNASVTTDGLQLGVEYGETDALGTTLFFAPSGDLIVGQYQMLTGTWEVPADTFFFSPRIGVADPNAAAVYMVDDARVLMMTGEEHIIAGAVTADKIAANSIVGEHIQAESIATMHLQSEAVTAEKIQAEAITAEKIAANAILANHIVAGAIQVDHISSDVGGSLNIEDNDSIQLIVGPGGYVDNLQEGIDGNTANFEEMRTYYNFGPDGAVISRPGDGTEDAVYALALRHDRIEMLENNFVVSFWNAGQMNVSQLVATKLTMGNHQIEKYGGGTVIRDL